MESNKKFISEFIKKLLLEFREWDRKWDLYYLNEKEKPDSIDVFINTIIQQNKSY